MMHQSMLDKIIEWAKTEFNIRAVVVTGSLSRNDGSTDEWSDLDVQLVCDELTDYLLGGNWLDGLGEIWIRFPLDEHSHYRLIWFIGGKKVDFQLTTKQPIHEMLETGNLSEEYQRGYIVALDKDYLYERLPPSPHIFPLAPLPSSEDVHEIINEFWFEAIHVAQFIRRREFWVAKFRDWTMKCNLLQMMEWHAQITNDEPINTWIIGKRIHQWIDNETQDALQNIWGGWDAESSWDSLLVMLELFSRLSHEVTMRLNYTYREETYQEILAYIRELYSNDKI